MPAEAMNLHIASQDAIRYDDESKLAEFPDEMSLMYFILA